MGAPGQTRGYRGMKRTASATLLPCECLQPMKSWLETALVCVAMAQAAGGETEPSKALFPHSTSRPCSLVELSDVLYGHALLFLGYLLL